MEGVETTSASMLRDQPRKVQHLLSDSRRHVDEQEVELAPLGDGKELQDGIGHLGAPQRKRPVPANAAALIRTEPVGHRQRQEALFFLREAGRDPEEHMRGASLEIQIKDARPFFPSPARAMPATVVHRVFPTPPFAEQKAAILPIPTSRFCTAAPRGSITPPGSSVPRGSIMRSFPSSPG